VTDRSRYDDLHDRYQQIRTTKRGTRYERLAAVVFGALERGGIVIHDLDVIGADTEVAHQIDIHVETGGVPKRLIVECKDFDVSRDPVGLDIVRSFWGVVDDVHPDEAWIITCNGFTAAARHYAKGKGIKLATLRTFADSDWENRIRTIVGTIMIENIQGDKPDVRIKMDDQLAQTFTAAMAATYPHGTFAAEDDRTQLYDGETIRSLSSIAQVLVAGHTLGSGQDELVEGKATDGWISPDGVRRFPIQGYRIALPIQRRTLEVKVSAVDGTAALLLTDGAGFDFILWDDALCSAS